jgi:hypothetical protein
MFLKNNKKIKRYPNMPYIIFGNYFKKTSSNKIF